MYLDSMADDKINIVVLNLTPEEQEARLEASVPLDQAIEDIRALKEAARLITEQDDSSEPSPASND